MTTIHGTRCFTAWTIATAILALSAVTGCGGGSDVPDTSGTDTITGLDEGHSTDTVADHGADDGRLDLPIQPDPGSDDVMDVSDPGNHDSATDDGDEPVDADGDTAPEDGLHHDADDVEDNGDEGGTDSIGPRDNGSQDLWQEPPAESIMVRFFSEDFEDLAESTIEDGPNYYSYPNTGTVELFSDEAGLAGARVVKIVDPAVEGTAPSFLLNFNTLTDQLTDTPGFVSFDINATGDVSLMSIKFGQDLSFRISSLNSEEAYKVSVDSNSQFTECVANMAKGRWVNFRVEVDWPNLRATLLLDNSTTGCTDIPLTVNTTPGFPRNIQFATSNRADTDDGFIYPGGTYMIDNVVFARQGETGFTRHPTTGQMWQRYPPAMKMSHADATDFCRGLSAPRGLTWRVPTIDELRTLVNGCNRTESGGGCGVTDSCTVEMDCRTPACDGCGLNDGCYLVAKMDGGCVYPYVSDTLASQITRDPWWLNFRQGYVGSGSGLGFIRCVLDYENGM